MNPVVRLLIQESSQVAEARRVATRLASLAGLNETDTGKVALIVTEAVTNLLKHAGGGELLLQSSPAGRTGRLEMVVLDKGPGMADVEACMRDGYSTAGSAGTGLGAMSRLATEFHVYSNPGRGTVITAQVGSSPHPAYQQSDICVDGWSVPMHGEEQCGDAWSCAQSSAGTTVLVADGLGHGPLAAAASSRAVQSFQEHHDLPLPELMETIHLSLKSTRGAAAAILRIPPEETVARCIGVGNIGTVLLSGGKAQHAVSMSGIVGEQARSFREFSYPWTPSTVAIMHSDGLNTRWDLSSPHGLLDQPEAVIAAVLYRDHQRGRDDTSVVVARRRVSA